MFLHPLPSEFSLFLAESGFSEFRLSTLASFIFGLFVGFCHTELPVNLIIYEHAEILNFM